MYYVQRKPLIICTMLVCMLGLVVWQAPPQTVFAQTSLNVSPQGQFAGEKVTLTGSGYPPGTYTIRWDGVDSETFDIPPDDNNAAAFTKEFTIPQEATDGFHTLSLVSNRLRQMTSIDVYVGTLVLDLTVSLEWEPSEAETIGNQDGIRNDIEAAGCPANSTPPGHPDPGGNYTYLQDLELALEYTSAYLYNFTEGQMSLGTIDVYTGGDNWEEADIQILADSTYRPSAFVGGIVDDPTLSPFTTIDDKPIVFYDLPIILGRLWNGEGARCGRWSNPAGWRTLGHELGHHALYLYDQYFNAVTGESQYCTASGIDFGSPSYPTLIGTDDTLMAYHYTTDKLWRGGVAPQQGKQPIACRNTPHELIYGGGTTEWEVIKTFYPNININAPPPSISWPMSPVANLFTFNGAPGPVDSIADIALEVTGELSETAIGEAYLVRPRNGQYPQRIIGQGVLLPDAEEQLPFLGVVPDLGDRAAVFVNDPNTDNRFAISPNSIAPLSLTNLNNLTTELTDWRPSITVAPTTTRKGSSFSEVVALNVRLEDCGAQSEEVAFAYCPAGGVCSESMGATRESDRTFTYTFFFSDNNPVALRGYIYARNGVSDAEAIVTYQLGGGVGTAYIGAHAPFSGGEITTEIVPGDIPPEETAEIKDTRVAHTTTPACSVPPTDESPIRLLGTPFNIQPEINTEDQDNSRPWNVSDPPILVRLSYKQDLLNRLGIAEEQLVVVRLNSDNIWEVVPTVGQSVELDWIAAEAQNFDSDGDSDGDFYALAYGPLFNFLPLIQR